MKRKTSETPSRIWTYGLPHGPSSPEMLEHIDNQMRLGHRYYNALIQIERERRQAYRAARSRLAPGLAEVEAQTELAAQALEVARTTIKTERAIKRGRTESVDLSALKTQLRDLRVKLKDLRAEANANPELAECAADIDAKALAAIKDARSKCGVYWGTYLLIEKAVDQARKATVDPGFKRFSEDGRVGVHITNGISVSDVMSETDVGSRLLKIAPPDGRKRTRLAFRVGSSGVGGRTPIWAEFNMILHRPLPSDARIKAGWVQRRRIGTRFRWELCLMLESRTFHVKPRVLTHACGIDLGWRRVESGYRVAMCVGTDGKQTEVILPDAMIARIDHSRGVRSVRDRHFETMRNALSTWIALSKKNVAMPEWLLIQAEHLDKWRSPERLGELVWSWREQRFDGDAEVFADLDAWRKNNRHLYQIEASERDRFMGQRRDFYRKTAIGLARAYEHIKVEALQLKDLTRRSAPEDKEGEMERAQRRARFDVAPGEFVAALKLAASNVGSQVFAIPPAYTTRSCHACSHACVWDQSILEHTCEACGVSWDQDVNAARNLLSANISEAAE